MINKLANYVIRPKRTYYNPQKDLGPGIFYVDGVTCGRIDFRVTNDQKQVILCSLYHRTLTLEKKFPCVVYCHGNCGNRTDCFESLKPMLSMDILVVCFDFPGCGLSDGNLLTLGWNENKDIDHIIRYIREEYEFIDPQRIGLWGRSMGAVSALLYTARKNDVKCIVLDSPFSDFPMLMEDYLNKYKWIAKMAGGYISRKLRDKIKERTGFDTEDLRPVNNVGQITCPVLYVHSRKDKLVHIKHSKALFESTKSEKHFFEIEVGHNDIRPDYIYNEIKSFLSKNLFPEAELRVQERNNRAFLYFSKVDQVKKSITPTPDYIISPPKQLNGSETQRSSVNNKEEVVRSANTVNKLRSLPLKMKPLPSCVTSLLNKKNPIKGVHTKDPRYPPDAIENCESPEETSKVDPSDLDDSQGLLRNSINMKSSQKFDVLVHGSPQRKQKSAKPNLDINPTVDIPMLGGIPSINDLDQMQELDEILSGMDQDLRAPTHFKSKVKPIKPIMTERTNKIVLPPIQRVLPKLKQSSAKLNPNPSILKFQENPKRTPTVSPPSYSSNFTENITNPIQGYFSTKSSLLLQEREVTARASIGGNNPEAIMMHKQFGGNNSKAHYMRYKEV